MAKKKSKAVRVRTNLKAGGWISEVDGGHAAPLTMQNDVNPQ
jgi:hypothetical protein